MQSVQSRKQDQMPKTPGGSRNSLGQSVPQELFPTHHLHFVRMAIQACKPPTMGEQVSREAPTLSSLDQSLLVVLEDGVQRRAILRVQLNDDLRQHVYVDRIVYVIEDWSQRIEATRKNKSARGNSKLCRDWVAYFSTCQSHSPKMCESY